MLKLLLAITVSLTVALPAIASGPIEDCVPEIERCDEDGCFIEQVAGCTAEPSDTRVGPSVLDCGVKYFNLENIPTVSENTNSPTDWVLNGPHKSNMDWCENNIEGSYIAYTTYNGLDEWHCRVPFQTIGDDRVEGDISDLDRFRYRSDISDDGVHNRLTYTFIAC